MQYLCDLLLFENVNLPYFNPHSFRNTIVRLGMNLCQNAEQFKTWSQNLGHEGVLTTLYSYGEVPEYRQAELMKKLNQPRVEQSPEMQIAFEAMLNQFMNKY